MFILLVGCPASGKSTWARELVKEAEKRNEKACIISSDSIREELWGDENIQGDPAKVFNIAHERIINALGAGYDKVIFDATNIKRKHRVALMEKIKKFKCKKYYYLFVEPYNVLCNRNRVRERHVPEEVIWNMITQFETPLPSEGYDNIYINNHNKINLTEYTGYMRNYNQHNRHHSQDLFTHCEKACKYINEKEGYIGIEPLSWAAFLHDIGKLFTQTFTNAKGELTEEAHYYGHDRVGGYLALLFDGGWSDKERILISRLICYHMQPYFNKTEKARQKWKNIWGEELNNLIMLLHEADVQAH